MIIYCWAWPCWRCYSAHHSRGQSLLRSEMDAPCRASATHPTPSVCQGQTLLRSKIIQQRQFYKTCLPHCAASFFDIRLTIAWEYKLMEFPSSRQHKTAINPLCNHRVMRKTLRGVKTGQSGTLLRKPLVKKLPSTGKKMDLLGIYIAKT